MRIFVASGIFHPDSGGPATYLYRLLPELQARGHQISALAYGNAPVEGYPYPLARVPFGRFPFMRWARYWVRYRRAASRADVIYINSLGLPRSGDARTPRVMKVVGDYAWERCVHRGWIPPTEDIDAFQVRRYGPRVEWFKANRRREVRSVDHVIVPSDYLRQMVIGWGADPARVQVIYNALEPGAHVPSLTKDEARLRLGWLPDGRYLLTAARLTAWKSVDYLIDAMVEIPDVRLVVAGEGPQLATLQAQAVARQVADRVSFLGKVPLERMPLLMRAADYLVLYSGYEGLSHTLLEALHAGTPVIASARGGNPEVVRDGENGILVPHPNRHALTAAIRRAFADDTPRQLAARTGVGLERFNWAEMVTQTERALLTCAGAARI